MTQAQKDVKRHCDLKSSWEEGREKDEGRKEGLEGSWADTTEKAAPHLAMNAKAHTESRPDRRGGAPRPNPVCPPARPLKSA